MTVVIDHQFVVGLESFYAERFPAAVKRATTLALNDTGRYALKQGRDQILKEINFPKGYLDETRLNIDSFATASRNEVVIKGRGRGTSLRRFAVGAPTVEATRIKGFGGVSVQVKVGGKVSTFNKPGVMSSFLIRLRSGSTIDDGPDGNVGLAVRIKPGQSINFKREEGTPLEIFPNVFLLYGPSVAQAFDLVAKEIAPDVTSELAREFQRQFFVQLGNI